MESRISNLINLKNKIVAVVQADELPPKVLQFQKGKWGCAVAMLAAAAFKIFVAEAAGIFAGK